MLSFFRRIINSKAGIVVTFLVLGVIAIAFAAGDVTGLAGSTGVTGGNVATVGKTKVSIADLRSRAQNQYETARQQQPTLDIAQFVSQGGLDQTVEQLISGAALEAFGYKQGMVVSKRSVDGQIASIPAFQGPTGQFDNTLYRQILAQRRLTDAQVRADFINGTIANALLLPTQGASQVGQQMALPYASLLLEKRQGQVAFVPTRAMPAGATPTDAEIQQFYARNVGRYTLPERRIVRYALVTPEMVAARATPTEAEIAQAYRAGGSRYAATQKRTIAQVVVADQAGATALAQRVRGGATIQAAAQAAGLEASTQTKVEKAAYATATSPQIADAAFAAAQGAVVGPVRGPLGWIVARVEAIQQVPGQTLDQARPAIVAELTKQKSAEALQGIRDASETGLAGSATFDEAIADQKLTAQATPALTAAGVNPEDPAYRPAANLAPIVQAAFQAVDGDAPQVVGVGTDGSFAIVAVGRIVPSAPRPLAQVRDAVVADLTADRARAAARRIAGEIVARANRGTGFAQAVSQAGVSAIQPPRTVTPTRAQLARDPRSAPPALTLMFAMKQGTAKLLEAPNNEGFFVVKLDRIEAGNAAGNPAALQAARNDLRRSVGGEYIQQFVRAVRADVGVKTDANAIARVRADLTGQGGSDTN